MADYLPETLMYSVGEVREVSRNRFKIFSVSADTASANKIVNFVLPENALIDMKSVKMFFDVACTGAGAGADAVLCKLPNYTSTMISRLEVFANGVALSAGSSLYGTIAHVLRLSQSNIDKDNSVDRALHHSYITGDNFNDDESLCLSDLGGFFDGSTRYLNTGLIGSISIRATFAPNSVLVPKQTAVNVGQNFTTPAALANAQQCSYQVSKMYMTVDTISLPQLYTDFLRERLEGGGLKYNYEEHYSFQMDGIAGNTTNSSTALRFALSTGCLTSCWGTYQDQNANGVVGIPCHSLPNAAGVSSEIANCLRFRSYSGETKKAGPASYEWVVNSVRYPQWKSSWVDGLAAVAYTQDKVDKDTSGTLITSAASYNDGKFVFPLMLNLPTGRGVGIMAGMSSRGINSQMVFQSGQQTIPAAPVPPSLDLNNSGTASCFVVASTVSQLRINLGRDLQVIY